MLVEQSRRLRFQAGFALICLLALKPPLSAEEATGTARPPSDPVSSEIELNRGIVDFEQGRYGDALNRLSKIGPPEAGTSYYRGLSLMALRRAKEALSQFEAASRKPGVPSEINLDLAVAQLEVGDVAKAQATLEKYLRTNPDDPYGHYFLGVALFRQKLYPAALAEFDRVADDAKFAPYLDFYRGLASYARGDGQHRRFFDQYQTAGITGPTADLTRRLLDGSAQRSQTPYLTPRGINGIQGPNPNRRWNLAVLSGYDYDTNVALVPTLTFTPLGLIGATGPADSRWTLASFGEYRLVQREDWILGLIGSTYDAWQFRLDRFNFQDYMGGAYSNVALGRRFILGNRYEFHEDLLGGRQFAVDHRLTPNFTIREDTLGHLTTYYEWESLDISGLRYAAPTLIRSGNIHSIGVTQAFYLANGAGRLFLEYRHDQAFTAGSDFDRRTEQLDARLEYPLPFKVVANIEARYFWDNYSNPNSLDFDNRARRDRRIEARAGFQKFFTPHVSLQVEYIYTQNDSNVENLFGVRPYMYSRNILSTQLIYDF